MFLRGFFGQLAILFVCWTVISAASVMVGAAGAPPGDGNGWLWPNMDVLCGRSAELPLEVAGELEVYEGTTPQDDTGGRVSEALCEMPTGSVTFLLGMQVAPVTVDVFIAARSAHHAAGYQSVGANVIDNTAMIFVFGADQQGAFHMCNVDAPLWIAWFDAAGAVVDVQWMEPGRPSSLLGGAASCSKLYAPGEGGRGVYRYALEMGESFFQRWVGTAPPDGWQLMAISSAGRAEPPAQ